MVKKAKEVEVNLYNFNIDEKNENKKNKSKAKSKSNTNKKLQKSKLNKKSKKAKTNKNKKKETSNKFDFNDETVIGIAKENKVNKNSKKKEKKRKTISKSEQERRRKKIQRNLKIFKYTFLTICIIVAIIATMASPLFDIKEIIIEGNEKITDSEIISLSKINLNENTYKVNKFKAEKWIEENPYIKSVKIQRKLPSTLLITVQERKATFMIEYGSGYAYINNQGYILEISSEKLDVPIIQGSETIAEELKPGNRLDNNDLSKMSTVIKIMEIAESNDISKQISRIDIENNQNYKIIFESEQKVAYLGDETDLNTKILSIKAILEKESGTAGEIFVNMDLKNNYPTFRQSV